MTIKLFTQKELAEAIKAEYNDGDHNIRMEALLDYDSVEITIQGKDLMLDLIDEEIDEDEINVVIQVRGDSRFFMVTTHYHNEFGGDWKSASVDSVTGKEITTVKWFKEI